MMQEMDLRSRSDQINQATAAKQLVHEIYNSAYNHHEIQARLDAGTARDVNSEPKIAKEPCFIIGSGPSLDDHIRWLRDWDGGIFCTTSHARTLMYNGIEPTHIVVLDPFCDWGELAGVDWSKTRTKLITHPGVWPDLIANWPNEMLLYRENLGKRNTFYADEQNKMYSRREGVREAVFRHQIVTEVTLFACSPPAQLFLADRLGYGTAFLMGVDFAFSETKERFTEWRPVPDKPGAWEAIRSPVKADPADYGGKLITTNDGKLSHEVHLYYKKNMMTAWRLYKRAMYSTDLYDTLPEVPHRDIEEVIAKRGKGFKPMGEKTVAKYTEPYLASIGCYVIQGATGYAFVESENPLIELEQYMLAMQRQYVCNNCGNQFAAKSNDEHDGLKCKVCENGVYKHRTAIDVADNLRRIRRLVQNE